MNAHTSGGTLAVPDQALSPLAGIGGEGTGEGLPTQGAGPAEGGAPPGMEGLALDTGSKRPRVSSSWFLIVGAVALSTGVLWGMRWIGMKGGISGKDVKFDQSLVEAASRPKRNHTLVLEDLKTSRITHQVPGERVKKNPFRLAEAMAGLMPVREPEDDGSADAAARLAASQMDAEKRRAFERAQTIDGELKGFKLQAVLGGSPPIARVNGKMVRVGDKLGKFFKVSAIHGRTIEVECDGKRFEVGISPTDVATGDGPED